MMRFFDDIRVGERSNIQDGSVVHVAVKNGELVIDARAGEPAAR